MLNKATRPSFLAYFCSSLFIVFLAVFFSSTSMAATSNQVRLSEATSQSKAVEVQEKVAQLSAQSQEDFQAWRQARRELLLLEAHNKRQKQWNLNLEEQLVSLEEQLLSLDSTRSNLEPLLENMARRLIEFIQQDLPFKQEERLFHARKLEQLLPRVDVSLAEKLRQLLTAYRQEVELGRSLSSSQELLNLGAGEKEYTLLRVGRIGLYYLSKNKQEAGFWNAQTSSWEELTSGQRQEVILGLELAAERGLPQFLKLPLSIPLRTAALQKSASDLDIKNSNTSNSKNHDQQDTNKQDSNKEAN